MINRIRLLLLSSFCVFLIQASVFAYQQDSTSTEDELPSEEKIADTTDSNYLPNSLKDYNEAYYSLTRLNNPLGFPPNKFNLQTPQATLFYN